MKHGCTSEDSNLKWDSGEKWWWFFSHFSVGISEEVENIPKWQYSVTLNPILTVIHLLLFICSVYWNWWWMCKKMMLPHLGKLLLARSKPPSHLGRLYGYTLPVLCSKVTGEVTSWEETVSAGSAISLQILSGRARALVCVLNRSREAVWLHNFPPCPSQVFILPSVDSWDDLSVHHSLKDFFFWNLSSIFIKL